MSTTKKEKSSKKKDKEGDEAPEPEAPAGDEKPKKKKEKKEAAEEAAEPTPEEKPKKKKKDSEESAAADTDPAEKKEKKKKDKKEDAEESASAEPDASESSSSKKKKEKKEADENAEPVVEVKKKKKDVEDEPAGDGDQGGKDEEEDKSAGDDHLKGGKTLFDLPPQRDPKRAQRATSNVFAVFKQQQIQEFKEAFTIIDQNRDGLIDPTDLAAIFTQIGHEPDQETLVGMVAEAPGPLNFTMFLSLFGDKLKGTDPETTLLQAFAMFDDSGKGKINEEYMKDLLTNVGDKFSKEEIRQVWKEAPISGGMLDYLKFVRLIKHGKDDD